MPARVAVDCWLCSDVSQAFEKRLVARTNRNDAHAQQLPMQAYHAKPEKIDSSYKENCNRPAFVPSMWHPKATSHFHLGVVETASHTHTDHNKALPTRSPMPETWPGSRYTQQRAQRANQ